MSWDEYLVELARWRDGLSDEQKEQVALGYREIMAPFYARPHLLNEDEVQERIMIRIGELRRRVDPSLGG